MINNSGMNENGGDLRVDRTDLTSCASYFISVIGTLRNTIAYMFKWNAGILGTVKFTLNYNRKI